MTETRALLEVTDLVKHYPVRSGILRRAVGTVHAVDGVSFTVGVGEHSGLSASPAAEKSTVARSVLRLVEPTGGQPSGSMAWISPISGRPNFAPIDARCRSSSRIRSRPSIRA